jgi:putative endonuclease
MYYVYILECDNDSLYTGITTDIERRFQEHQEGRGGHFTSSTRPIRIVYTEQYPSRSSALRREIVIKSWPKAKKLKLIERSQK